MFGGNFAPRGWALCNGSLLAISQNSALFSILGTTYGGDGRTTFGLPELRGRSPVHEGNGPGIGSLGFLGSKGGAPTTTINSTNLPQHTHTVSAPEVRVNPAEGIEKSPDGHVLAAADDGEANYHSAPEQGTALAGVGTNLANSGGQQAFNNMPPYLAIQFCIALQGTFPSRN